MISEYAEFEAIKKDNPDKLIVIDFFAEYCSSCMAMLPIYAEVAQDFKGRALFYKVDVGAHFDLAQQFLVTNVPCLQVFENGKLRALFNNAMNKQELTDFVEKALKEAYA
jgi:thioredoxin 1